MREEVKVPLTRRIECLACVRDLVKQNIVQLAHIDHFAALFTLVEAGAGIEPANSGFADRDLTTWLPRRWCEK